MRDRRSMSAVRKVAVPATAVPVTAVPAPAVPAAARSPQSPMAATAAVEASRIRFGSAAQKAAQRQESIQPLPVIRERMGCPFRMERTRFPSVMMSVDPVTATTAPDSTASAFAVASVREKASSPWSASAASTPRVFPLPAWSAAISDAFPPDERRTRNAHEALSGSGTQF